MEPLNRKTILPYLSKNIFPHLKFIKEGKLESFEEVGGGLVSLIFRIVVDSKPLYIKQAIKELKLDGLSFLPSGYTFPSDFRWIFRDDRQLFEVKALNIFEKAVGKGFAPHVYYHDVKNRVMILSEVLSPKARLFEDIIDKKINLKACETLAKIAAKLANNTYGRIKPLRSSKEDKEIKYAKLKYQCLEVCNKLKPKEKKLVKKVQSNFVKESMKIDKVLVHGDYHPRNILIEDSKVGTCDLEEAHLGDPSFDIGILLGSCLLRADYHKNMKDLIIKAVLRTIKLFLQELKIPEDKERLENRIKKTMGGLMLGRLDGLSRKWTTWIKRESAKKSIRNHAVRIILDQDTPTFDLIKKIYT